MTVASAARTVTDAERRARLAIRHALAPAYRLGSVEDVAAAMVCLHATEPPTVHLAVAARSDRTVDDVEASLYVSRTVVKQLAMRRTLFAFPRELLPLVLGSASARVAQQQRRLLAKDVEKYGVADDGAAWVERACVAVLERLSTGEALQAKEIREQVPEVDGRMHYARGKSYGGSLPVAPRLLTLLGAEGHIMRAENAGHWRTSRPAWVSTRTWLGAEPEPTDERTGYAELVRRWLDRFGPGTEDDLVWWLGATKSAVRQAIADIGAVPVSLETGQTGWLLAEDLDEVEDPGDWAALLPVLDPTAMGWKSRGFYFDPAHVPYLMDTNGNIGTTAWWNGRIVGGWVQDEGGRVRVVLHGDPGARVRGALDEEAERLTAFFGGVVISSVYKSHLMKGEPLP
ncbi:MAG: winged helix DNA-binding domain-containing protein [Actinomycetales bacterium]|nr:winged helix DNA-binding domain-containing protein [Actinomycetales bacterium]